MKIWAYIILAGILVAAIGGASRLVWKAGYDARDTEIRDDAIAAQNAAIQKGIDDWIATQDLAEAEIVVEERIVEKIRVVEKEIPTVVERIVEVTPECSNLGPDYASLLNQQIRASNDSQVPDTEPATALVN